MTRSPLHSIQQKPLVYIDQNILDWISKGRIDFIRTFIKEKAQLIYSLETLNEIARAQTKRHNEFLSTLKELEAIFYELQLTEDNQYANEANPTQLTPQEALSNHLNTESDDCGASDGLGQFLFKLLGGRKGESFNPILDALNESFDRLTIQMKEELYQAIDAKQTTEDVPKDLVDDYISSTVNEWQRLDRELRSTIDQQIPHQEDFHGPNVFRNHVSLSPKVLNNIKPPHVVQQIWELISHSETWKTIDVTMNQFFGVDPHSFEAKDNNTWATKINGAYNVLNFVGYWPDEATEKEKQFISFQSDSGHAVFGAYADLLITGDKRFFKKICAVFELVQINNVVMFLEFNNQQENWDLHQWQLDTNEGE